MDEETRCVEIALRLARLAALSADGRRLAALRLELSSFDPERSARATLADAAEALERAP